MPAVPFYPPIAIELYTSKRSFWVSKSPDAELSPDETALSLYRQGGPLAGSKDLLARADHLLVIHEMLRWVFPHNIELAYRWVSQPNWRFGNVAPLEIMIQGLEGLLVVRHYLDREREA